MKSWILSPRFVTATALALALLAAPSLLSAAQPEPAEVSEPAGTLLVWHLPDQVPGDRPMELTVEVLRDGRALLTEVATVGPSDREGRRAVELLASTPELRHRYALLAARGGVELDVRLAVDGQVVAQHPLAALITTGVTQDTRLLPLAFPDPASAGDETQLFLVTGADCTDDRAACVDACRDDYYDCMYTVCFPQRRCDECDSQHQACLDACPECCTEPKSVTYTTSAQQVSATWLESRCYKLSSGGEAHTYDHYWVEYKLTRYKHTEACDGTVTTTVDSVWYESGDCWDRPHFIECFNGTVGFPYPSC